MITDGSWVDVGVFCWRYEFITCRVGCTWDRSPGWFHTRPNWHLARNAGYCKYDSWPTNDTEVIVGISRHALRIASLIHEYSKSSDSLLRFFGESPLLPERPNNNRKPVVSVLRFSINSLRQLSRLELHTSSMEETLRKDHSFTTSLFEPSFRKALRHGTVVWLKNWRNSGCTNALKNKRLGMFGVGLAATTQNIKFHSTRFKLLSYQKKNSKNNCPFMTTSVR